ncbi:zinc finger protein 277-like [Oppia nitens]|uniref:zinc finger protein 277-like n=1 Tax=Oppia nitens TaxID=1686743 RepID=UPI0023DBEF1A|nr:zinc finger protein 277-like [Oppia nitens]
MATTTTTAAAVISDGNKQQHQQQIHSLYLKSAVTAVSADDQQKELSATTGAPVVVKCLVCDHIVSSADAVDADAAATAAADQNKSSDPLKKRPLSSSSSVTTLLATDLQKHLLTEHKLIIADIDTIANLEKYCDYWRSKFAATAAVDANNDWRKQFCAAITTNSGPNDVCQSETYYMIGGDDQHFPEDSQLRQRLKEARLESLLRQSQLEINDTEFSRQCLFCRRVFTENRSNLFRHLAADHNFNVGHPDNIVNCSQLLDELESRLGRLECLYCERTFKSWPILKEHMRKKGHKILNPDNRQYDRYYLINYLSPEKDWREVKLEADDDRYDRNYRNYRNNNNSGGDEEDNDDSNEWDDWTADMRTAIADTVTTTTAAAAAAAADDHCICLFCRFESPILQLKTHLNTVHGFDFDRLVIRGITDFYQRIKLINYLRRSVHNHRCPKCEQQFGDCDQLVVHLDFSGHISSAAGSGGGGGDDDQPLPDKCLYDLPEYYFSTYENDNLLHYLDTIDE